MIYYNKTDSRYYGKKELSKTNSPKIDMKLNPDGYLGAF